MIPLRKLEGKINNEEEAHDPLLASEPHDEHSVAGSDEWDLGAADSDDSNIHTFNVVSPEKTTEDPFLPFDDLPDEDRNILTLRAILVGSLCGGLVNASSIYLGLKSGWTDSANIFGSIVGFAVLKACETYCGGVPILGGDFGARENNIVQTVATVSIVQLMLTTANEAGCRRHVQCLRVCISSYVSAWFDEDAHTRLLANHNVDGCWRLLWALLCNTSSVVHSFPRAWLPIMKHE